MMTSLLLVLMGSGQMVHAAGQTYTIKQLVLNRQRIVVESNGEIQPGTELIATFKDGSQCPLKVTAAQGHLANADVSECSLASSMVAGQSLERSLFVEESGSTERAPAPRRASKASSASASTAPSTSQKWTPRPPPPRAISDVQYLPKAGQLAFVGAYTYDQLKTSTSATPSNDKVVSNTITSHQLAAALLYGYSDRVAFGVKLPYLVGQTKESSYGPGTPGRDGDTDKSKSDGLGDPTVGVIYRLTEQDTVPVIIDFSGAYSPNTGKYKAATPTAHGNGYRGGDVFSLSAEVGNKGPTYGISAALDLDFYGSYTAVDADTGTGLKHSPRNVYTLRVTGQTEIGDQLYLRGILRRITVGDQSDDSQVNVDSTSQTVLTGGLVKELDSNLAMQFMVTKALSVDGSAKLGNQSFDSSSEDLNFTVSVLKAF